MGSEHYCLRWNNHQSNLLGVFSQLLQDESLVDVTLASAEGLSLRAHKVVLSACSSYFRSLFLDHPNRHPIVILKDVGFAELRTLIDFMYRGEVSVETCRLSALLKTAESLQVKGLAEMTAVKSGTGTSGGGEREETDRMSTTPPQSRQASPSRSRQPSPPPRLPSPQARLPSPQAGQASPLTRMPSPPTGQASPHSRLPSPHSRLPSPHSRLPSPHVAVVSSASGGPGSSQPVDEDSESLQSGPSDMTIPHSRPTSPPLAEPLPGPSGLPPVQDAPLSLKKEVDWDRNEESKSTAGESSSEYRHPHDPEVCLVEGEFGPSPSSSQSMDQLSRSSRSSTPFQFPSLGGLGLYGESVLSLLQAHEALGVRCSVCLAGFPAPWLLDQHVALQHPGQAGLAREPLRDDKPFRCEQCGQSYRYRSAYLKHREQNHRARLPADKLFTCDVCGMQFRYLKSFKKHRLNHTLERIQASPRRSSEREKEEDEERREEVSSTNEAVGRPAVSSDQDDTVDSAEGGEASLIGLLQLGDRQRPTRSFACPFCGKCVRSKENLKLHVRKHTGERPFACLFCGRAFGGKSDLTRHLRIHTGERPYHCEMCGKCFARADYLSKHLTTHIHQGHHR